MTLRFEGIYPVLPTPLMEDESLDLNGFRHLVDFFVQAGMHGLVVLGSGGEYTYLTLEEKVSVARAAAEACGGRIPLIAGVGFPSLRETLAFLEACRGLRIDGFMVALPTYYAVPFAEVLGFFQEICRASPQPVLYYHFPQVTGLFFTASQLGRIFALDRVVGIKESSVCLREIRAHIRKAQGKPFSVLAGTCFLLRRLIELGGHGAICPLPTVAPRLILDCYEAAKRGESGKANRLQQRILDLLPLMNSFELPVPVQKVSLALLARMPRPARFAGVQSRHAVFKETLRQLGHPISARVRTPLPQITERQKQAIRSLIERSGDLRSARTS